MAINPHIEKLKREAAELYVETRVCMDCRFYDRNYGHPKCKETGEFISMERAHVHASLSRCGPDGLLWQKRQESKMTSNLIVMVLLYFAMGFAIGFFGLQLLSWLVQFLTR